MQTIVEIVIDLIFDLTNYVAMKNASFLEFIANKKIIFLRFIVDKNVVRFEEEKLLKHVY